MVKLNIAKFFLLISILSCVGVSVCLWNRNTVLESKESALAHTETMTSTVQRVSKIELERGMDEELMLLADELSALVDDMCAEFYSAEVGGITAFADAEEIIVLLEKVIVDWDDLKTVLLEYRMTKNRDALYLASEESYKEATIVIDAIRQHMVEYAANGDLIRNFLAVNIVCIVVFLAIVFLNTHKELQKNKEISKDMYLDTATGIYNRAKCQEILKTPPSNRTGKRAVIVFDLNDLKKTNDMLGHRAGDDLIYDFAQQIYKATKSFEYDIFVGRYGGDEFMAFFDEIEESEVKNYIAKVGEILHTFNETKNKPYQLSCAVGYSIAPTDNPSTTNRELFDIADANMFKNKMAMKEMKKQELLEQGIAVEESIDDRL